MQFGKFGCAAIKKHQPGLVTKMITKTLKYEEEILPTTSFKGIQSRDH